ncbi:hypothetical protein EHZ18_27095 [Burkholderia vietnamiensis]|nr:hypothetical protein EHZ18_27095 [Burkholderia vietnamiensis]
MMSYATPILPSGALGHVPEMTGHVAEIAGHDPETAGHVRPKYAPSPRNCAKTASTVRCRSSRSAAASTVTSAAKKIARASDEARAKPSPYEDRRRGHRDPRAAQIIIECAGARCTGICGHRHRWSGARDARPASDAILPALTIPTYKAGCMPSAICRAHH